LIGEKFGGLRELERLVEIERSRWRMRLQRWLEKCRVGGIVGSRELE